MICNANKHVWLYSISFLIYVLNACTSVPESDFYETEGVLVISSINLVESDDWTNYQDGSITSRINSGNRSLPSSLHFPFFLQNPGSYEVWFLVRKAISHQDEYAEFRVQVHDETGYLHHDSGAIVNRGDLYQWVSASQNVNSDLVYFSDPGFYSVHIILPAGQIFSVSKMQMISDPLNRPTGMGLPETNRHNMDPVLEKREQRVDFPPSWIFGVLEGGIERVAAQKAERIHKKIDDFYTGSVKREIPVVPDLGQLQIDGLKKHIEMVSNPLLVTYEYPFALWPVDITEHDLVYELSDEKLLRWIQFQTFNSVMSSVDPNYPDNLTPDREMLSEQIEELKNFRNSLFPYIYSLAHLASRSGGRVVRGDSNYPDQFTLGEAFLIVPAVDEGIEERFVYLPDGQWFDYRTGTAYQGGQSWLVEVSDLELPMFRRAGSIVPLRTESKSVLDGDNSELIIEVATGAPGTFRLYEDDGITTNYQQGEFSTTAFRYFEHEYYATFTIGRMVRGYRGQPDEKITHLKFIYSREPVSVKANGTELEVGSGLNQWNYNKEERTLTINWKQPNEVKTDFMIRFSER